MSLAQVKLLAEGQRRNEARRAMLELEVVGAVLAGLGDGGREARGLHERLRKQAD